MILSSDAFEINKMLPKKYTCDGEGVNPPLNIFETPTGTQSLALLMEDLDAPGGIFFHWTIWNIEPVFYGIPEGQSPTGSVEGKNTFGNIGYGAPCPPEGSPHRYLFRVYALSEKLDLPQGSSPQEFLAAIEGKILDQAETMPIYGR